MDNETWRPVVGWEGYYEVSDMGRVCSVERVVYMGRGQTRRDSFTPDNTYPKVGSAEPAGESAAHVIRRKRRSKYDHRNRHCTAGQRY